MVETKVISKRKRIWGWSFFDWAGQPYFTLGMTFVFGPYFAEVASNRYLSEGLSSDLADAQAQSLWSLGATISGLIVAVTAPILGAWADNSGRKIPWIAALSVVFVLGCASMWLLTPDGSNLVLVMVLFYIASFAVESKTNLTNAILPTLGDHDEVGKISGDGAALGYWGGLLSLIIMLLLLAENQDGVTLLGNPPILGLDPVAREGTRSVGPLSAIWYVVFMIPFFAWVRDDKNVVAKSTSIGDVFADLKQSISNVAKNKSLTNYLIGSMLYRDALNALYGFGGVYAVLVLNWSIIEVGIFGVIGAVAAAIITSLAGRADSKFGPKKVIQVSTVALALVSLILIMMTENSIFGIHLGDNTSIPDIIFYVCGSVIGGAGGTLQASSRSLMVRHTTPDRASEAFGLYALSGKATAFLAPALIGLATRLTDSTRLGFVPLVFLFFAGLYFLRHVESHGKVVAVSAH